jgi:LPXTG-motif cell wall-anchored protein
MYVYEFQVIGELGRRAPRANTKRAARAGVRRAAPTGGAANRQVATQPKPNRKQSREANKAKRQARKSQRKLSQKARQTARRVARMMKGRRKLFNRLFAKGLRSLGNTPAVPAVPAAAAAAQAQPNSEAAAVVQFENHMLAQLNEAEIEALGKYVSAVYAQNVTEANIEAFTRAEMGKDPTLATALMKVRSGWQRTSTGSGGRADTNPIMPNARDEGEDFESASASASGSAANAANAANRSTAAGEDNSRNLLIGGAIVVGAALFMLIRKNEKKKKK